MNAGHRLRVGVASSATQALVRDYDEAVVTALHHASLYLLLCLVLAPLVLVKYIFRTRVATSSRLLKRCAALQRLHTVGCFRCKPMYTLQSRWPG